MENHPSQNQERKNYVVSRLSRFIVILSLEKEIAARILAKSKPGSTLQSNRGPRWDRTSSDKRTIIGFDKMNPKNRSL